jgi:hypothetical protein
VKPVSLGYEPPDDELDVAARTTGHLITHQLRFPGQALLPHRAAELAQLLPHLVSVSIPVAAQPVRRSGHDPSILAASDI